MNDREKAIHGLELVKEDIREMFTSGSQISIDCLRIDKAIALLKEQDELLKHEYWRGYNNGRADERGLQEGTIMQTFSPD